MFFALFKTCKNKLVWYNILKVGSMDNIKIADICGLCGGCKNAISTAIKAQKQYGNVTIFKEIVHNPTVNNMLINNGIKYAYFLDDIQPDSTAVLRAHGEPPKTYNYLKSNNINYIDCTCPKVKQIHAQVAKYSKMGYDIVVIGKHGNSTQAMHPEVVGTIGWSFSPVIVVENVNDLPLISNSTAKNIYLVCQTTFDNTKAENLIAKIKNICTDKQVDLVIDKTICNAQQLIKESSVKLAKQCDVMVVVGGKNSSNTQELYKQLTKIKPTIFLQDINLWQQEFNKNNICLSPTLKIGITAGASTIKQELTTLQKLINEQLDTNFDSQKSNL